MFNWNLLIIPFALVLGSFVGAFTYRLPKKIGFIKGRSFCDSCHKQLKWFENIPLLSFVFLKGKSYCCKNKINSRYFFIELSSAIAAVYLFNTFPIWTFVLYYLLFSVCLCIFVIDLEYQIIPDELVWVVFFLSLFLNFDKHPFPYLFSGFISSLFLLSIHLLTKGHGMGLGDVKLAIALGSWLVLYNSLIWLFGAFLTGGVVASILLVFGKAGWKQKIAFGPFLITAFLYVLFVRNINF